MADPAAGGRVVLGIGNPVRGDDAVGRHVIRLLRRAPLPGVQLVELDGEATALLRSLEGAAAAVVVDASHSGAAAGTIRRFDAVQAPLPQAAFGLTTHGFGLAEAIELARALGQLPRRCIVYAIEGAAFGHGAPLSPAAATAADVVAAEIRDELADGGRGRRDTGLAARRR